MHKCYIINRCSSQDNNVTAVISRMGWHIIKTLAADIKKTFQQNGKRKKNRRPRITNYLHGVLAGPLKIHYIVYTSRYIEQWRVYMYLYKLYLYICKEKFNIIQFVVISDPHQAGTHIYTYMHTHAYVLYTYVCSYVRWVRIYYIYISTYGIYTHHHVRLSRLINWKPDSGAHVWNTKNRLCVRGAADLVRINSASKRLYIYILSPPRTKPNYTAYRYAFIIYIYNCTYIYYTQVYRCASACQILCTYIIYVILHCRLRLPPPSSSDVVAAAYIKSGRPIMRLAFRSRKPIRGRVIYAQVYIILQWFSRVPSAGRSNRRVGVAVGGGCARLKRRRQTRGAPLRRKLYDINNNTYSAVVAVVSRASGGGAPMDQLTSGARGTDSPSSISGAICCPPVRLPTAIGGGDSSRCQTRPRDVFIGRPQIDRSGRNRRFNVSAPTSRAHCSVVHSLWILHYYYTAGT